MGREGNRKAYPLSDLLRRQSARGSTTLLAALAPPLAAHAALHHPQPHVLLRPQRRAPGTTAAALSTGTERGRKGRLRERDEGKQATEAGAAARREASEGDGGDRRLLLNSLLFFLASCRSSSPAAGAG
jgi:hypothetical protein